MPFIHVSMTDYCVMERIFYGKRRHYYYFDESFMLAVVNPTWNSGVFKVTSSTLPVCTGELGAIEEATYINIVYKKYKKCYARYWSLYMNDKFAQHFIPSLKISWKETACGVLLHISPSFFWWRSFHFSSSTLNFWTKNMTHWTLFRNYKWNAVTTFSLIYNKPKHTKMSSKTHRCNQATTSQCGAPQYPTTSRRLFF